MTGDPRRITLVSRTKASPERAWVAGREAPRRVIFVDSFGAIPYALARGIEELGCDVEAVIIDGTASPIEFLHLLSTLPAGFHGDVALILSDCAFISATGRGGDRLLYRLSTEDVRFYLETQMLVRPAVEGRAA